MLLHLILHFGMTKSWFSLPPFPRASHNRNSGGDAFGKTTSAARSVRGSAQLSKKTDARSNIGKKSVPAQRRSGRVRAETIWSRPSADCVCPGLLSLGFVAAFKQGGKSILPALVPASPSQVLPLINLTSPDWQSTAYVALEIFQCFERLRNVLKYW